MSVKKRILIVEDERIIAEDIKRTLKNFGYDVIKIVSSGPLAIETTLAEKPDLVLMDIMLEGKMSGIVAADTIRKQMDIPIIYLTAYADENTLKEAKITQPFGYIIKPFEERELHATLEMAFYRNTLEVALRDSEKRYRTLVETMDEGIVIVDEKENLTFVNKAAVSLFGYSKEELLNMSIGDFTSPTEFEKIKEKTQVRKEGISDKYELTIISRDGTKHFTTVAASPMVIDNKYHGTFAVITDITKRKIAEQIARRKTSQQRSLLEAAHVLNTSLDIHKVLTMIGEEAAKILNCYTCAIYILEDDGKTLQPVMVIDPEYAEETLNTKLNIDKSLTGKAIRQRTAMFFNDAGVSDKGTLIPGTGNLVNERVIVAPLMQGSNVVGALALSRLGEKFTDEDLTLASGYANFASNAMINAQTYSALQKEMRERKEAEKELKKTQFRLATILNNVPNILIYENHSDRSYISENVEALTGYSAQEFISHHMSLSDLIHPEDEDVVTKKVDQWIAEGSQGMLTLWYRMQCKDGRYLFIEDRKVGMTDEDGTNYQAGILVDNTALKQVEKDLRTSEARYKAVVHDQTELISRYNADGVITFVNEAYGRFYGINPEEFVGTDWISNLPEEIKDTVLKRLKQLSPEEPVACYEYATTRNNRTYWIEWTYRGIFDDDGNVREYQSVGKDITARKEAEEEKEKIQKQFLQAQKMETIGRLAGGIAHDFNNLLTAINGYAEMALKKVDSSEKIYEDIEIILKSGQRGAKLTQQLLGFSRQQVVHLKALDINNTISELQKMLNLLIGEDIKLITRLTAVPGMIKADSGQIEQILVNLVVNARDAISGSGIITVSTANRAVHEEIAAIGKMVPEGEFVVLTVKDTGSGIPENIRTKIFDPFFTTKEIGKGTGLGLATVISIVEQNSGFICLDSEVGVGTTFIIYFPAIQEEAASSDEIEETGELPTGTETILLVEDEDYIREFVAEILEEHGYNVLQAEDGQDALDLIADTTPVIDLLFTDVRMPRIKGPELAERMLQTYPDLRVILVSGYADDKTIRDAISADQTAFVQKPFNVPTLIKKVRSILDA